MPILVHNTIVNSFLKHHNKPQSIVMYVIVNYKTSPKIYTNYLIACHNVCVAKNLHTVRSKSNALFPVST